MMESNPSYLERGTISLVKEIYGQNKKVPSVVLYGFFTDETYAKIKKTIYESSKEKKLEPLQYSYKESKVPKDIEVFFKNKNFEKLIHKITGKTYKIDSLSIKSFTWKDYTLLHDKHHEKPGIDLILDVTENWDFKNGGAVVYVDGTGDYFPVISQENSLTIAKRNPTVHKFVKYLNNGAKNKERTLVFITAV